ncbi:protein tweety homolog 2 isoform X2 [Meriones unguiculatus]|uniref:protein tweety homolog 2 isoform X2 n=1 Tax=Meriones unguiculatus TaxID=10047 RepID=UPI00293F685B|nr:protein tweety homolog 2 isoform X2 [Meriones unguiculatus]
MPAARVEYIAPWWVVWLHSVPHLGLRLQRVDSTFSPGDETYQESLLFLGVLAAIGLGLNLIFLTVYLLCACCCRRDHSAQSKQPNSFCVTWTAVVAGLICCAAVGVGFYGNSETNDGVHQLIYSLDNANHTFSGIDELGTSDFCMAPDIYILNNTQNQVSSEVTRYYLHCSQSLSSPFQQSLTVFQRSLTTMQIQVVGLLQFAVPLFPTAEKELLGIQLLLNSSETSLHQLTAMLDCRGLHKDYLDALTGICYDGIEGLLFLGLFSLLAALAFSILTCAGPRAWKHFINRDRDYDDIDEDDPFNPQARRIAAHNPTRGQLHSFCSYSSGLGSQCSLQPPAQTISNAPVSEYMNQAILFGGNPRYENVPLIGRGSPPPTYSPSMRATYMSVADEHLRHYEFPS